MTIHELKTHPEPFEAVRLCRKRFEMRSTADRTFAVGDVLRLREWDPKHGDYTGRSLSVSVLYILPGGAYGVPEGYCVMSIMDQLVETIQRERDCAIERAENAERERAWSDKVAREAVQRQVELENLNELRKREMDCAVAQGEGPGGGAGGRNGNLLGHLQLLRGVA